MTSDSKFLKDVDIDKLIEKKIENEIQSEIEEAHRVKETVIISKFADVPRDKIFMNCVTYKLFNRKTKKECFINGTQAESFLGLNQSVRDDLENAYADNFTVNEYYVRFHVYKQD